MSRSSALRLSGLQPGQFDNGRAKQYRKHSETTEFTELSPTSGPDRKNEPGEHTEDRHNRPLFKQQHAATETAECKPRELREA